ncbi:hypothetical protein HG531_012319 [Fusarium graminearum]|nr:hypothetical protein HG531_012319 [Fusarium graminearum]
MAESGVAHKVISVILRLSELASAIIVLGILSRLTYLVGIAGDSVDGRIIYVIVVASLGIMYSIMFCAPFKSLFLGFPFDFVMFVMWLVAYCLLQTKTGTHTCTARWYYNYWGYYWGRYWTHGPPGTVAVNSAGCASWRTVLSFSFIAWFLHLLSGILGVYVFHTYIKLDETKRDIQQHAEKLVKPDPRARGYDRSLENQTGETHSSMASYDEESHNQLSDGNHTGVVNETEYFKKTDFENASNQKEYWWFLSTGFPMIAGTLGPVASAFSICSMSEPWRQQTSPEIDIQNAPSIANPPWLLIIETVQLLVSLISNLFLLLSNRLRDSDMHDGDFIWSQSFYYGIWAAILYFVDATLLATTYWSICTGHYHKTASMTTSHRTLMLQSIMLLLYLLLGAYVFSKVESWEYLDAVYWAFVTLFTVGFGDYYPGTTLGRGLLIPFALAGIISLGLVISSVRSLIIEEGSRYVSTAISNRRRERMIKKLLSRGHGHVFEPIQDGIGMVAMGKDEPHQNESERRKAEFTLMRRIQAKASTRRRWLAMAISTFLWLVLWLLGAVVFQHTEQTYQGWSYFDAFYFCFEAWTTIGYGDLTPVSNAGKSFYVFWSLLSLPIMTVLISNASDTVVRIIRDVTILIGNVTILPNDRPFLRNLKGLINKVTFGKVFSSQVSESLIPAVCGGSLQKGNIERSYGNSRHDRLFTITGNDTTFPSRRLGTRLSSTSTPDLGCHAQNHFTMIDAQALLLSEIQNVTIHLQESRPHQYTFEQWAWYLKILGEDESSPETHCSANLQSKRPMGIHNGSDDGLKWSESTTWDRDMLN